MPIIEIDLSTAPPPPAPIPALIIRSGSWAAAMGVLLFFVLAFWVAVLRALTGWVLSLISPSWEQAFVSFVAPFDNLFARDSPYSAVALTIGAGISAVVVAVLVVVHLLHLRNWRVPHYDVPIKAVSAKLRRLAARGRLIGRRGRLWGWIFLGAFTAALAAPFVAREYGINLFAEVWALFPPGEEGLAKGVTAAVYFLALAVLLLNALRLMMARATARRHFLSALLRLAPFAGAIAAYFLFSSIVFLIYGLGPFPEKLDSSEEAFLTAVLGGVVLMFVTLFTLMYWLYPHAHNLAQPLARDAMRSDRRSPIVFLRSFHDDFRQVKTSAEGDSASLGEITSKDAIGFEGLLSDISKPFGPFIAIARPGSAPSAEAARAYFAGEEWRDAVVQWMDDARLLLMIAGYTDGLHWELSQTIQRGHAGKVIFLFPPDDPYTDARWAWVKAAFRDHQVAQMMGRTAPKNVIGLHLDATGALIVLRSEKLLSRNYRAALAVAFYGLLDPP